MSDWIRITVTEARGSTPREPGTAMRVWAETQEGTIGGGTLEWQATQTARQMLAEGHDHAQRRMALGPDMGQCCGGAVTLEFIRNACEPPGETAELWLWGAGHVGRAIAATMAPLGDPRITLIDTSAARLPDPLPAGVTPLIAADPLRAVRHAPREAGHIIVTFSHDLDLALCDALLGHGFASCGLIGSATKWARFRKRLAALGHSAAQISRIACPIGDPRLGKHPQAIAIGVAARYLARAARTAESAAPKERRA
ncbi:xanthine dehydrogenase accessory protein XdhC [Marinovum sp.]|uniref:xanthine dehydrogenase accessory protein XdhC n=1 Tax=Marinovum sp. TaxID=2024839 RepID=UPI002B267605|nr:xanthine dehydrogenase accessory protein XdhC [Marinovum sp.]